MHEVYSTLAVSDSFLLSLDVQGTERNMAIEFALSFRAYRELCFSNTSGKWMQFAMRMREPQYHSFVVMQEGFGCWCVDRPAGAPHSLGFLVGLCKTRVSDNRAVRIAREIN